MPIDVGVDQAAPFFAVFFRQGISADLFKYPEKPVCFLNADGSSGAVKGDIEFITKIFSGAVLLG